MENYKSQLVKKWVTKNNHNAVIVHNKIITDVNVDFDLTNRLADGWYCGYVGVPKNSPLYDKSLDVIDNMLVHGSVTFANQIQNIDYFNPELYYIGFDTMHFDDFDNPKSLDYVEQECENLSSQIAIINQM